MRNFRPVRESRFVQKAERDWMFSDEPKGNIRPFEYNKLKGSKTTLLNNEDHDVFGDGTVVIISAPGHTPAHQVLFGNLAKTGPLLLAGDLYHYPEGRTNGKVPPEDFDGAQTLAALAKIEDFVKQKCAQRWIEHDGPRTIPRRTRISGKLRITSNDSGPLRPPWSRPGALGWNHPSSRCNGRACLPSKTLFATSRR
jgi:glyoxylase-like metal-dependent hydrolase (beta-lactamase superfamily II)